MPPNPDSIRLYGTDEPVEPPKILRVGPLTAEFDAGNLRHLRHHGREMIRAISFVVRDENWGTYPPHLTELRFAESPDSFRVSYAGTIRGNAREFRYSALIEGKADGSLLFSATGTATTDFLTNRTGFVVLHPIDRVAGAPCTVEHVDGSIETLRFPLLISPLQPMLGLRAITHEFSPGLKVTCRMEGDTFEMEDQRNWTDASYKTYVRPLALPWPYVIAAGESVDQRVRLTVSGSTDGFAAGDDRLSITVGEVVPGNVVPPLGFGLHPKNLGATEACLETLRHVAPGHLVCHYDPGRGHTRRDLERMVAVGQALGGELWLEFVVGDLDGFERVIEEGGRAVRELGGPFAAVAVSPSADLKGTLPGSPWPPCPPLDACYRAARTAFPDARLGGGMFSLFTELNRKRPPVEHLDFVTFTTGATLHAGDDRSVMEGLESLPYLAKTIEAFIFGKPYHVGPSAIGFRLNPYGKAPLANPGNLRQAISGMDPRQRGVFGAAWAAGYFARFAKAGASAITLGEGVGEFGIVYAQTDHPQPWFDEHGGVYPVYHVMAGLAGLRGQPSVDLVISKPDAIGAIAAEREGHLELWVANLTDRIQTVELAPRFAGRITVLSAASFEEAAGDVLALESSEKDFAAEAVTLPPYAVARLRGRRVSSRRDT